MYTSYFGLKENPFNLTPDPQYFFLSQQHSEALNHLIYGINEKKGFIVVTGGIGTGKTTISRTLLAELDDSVASALVFNPSLSDMELLKTIVQEFGIETGEGSPTKKRYIDALNRFLLKNFADGKKAVLLIDEAQNLSRTVLEQIRMLSNLETEREKLIQIVLLGQPELQELLSLPSLRQLNERITVRYDLAPLDHEQVKHYITHRLNVASEGNENVEFSPGALKIISDYSKGIPRRINAICDRALLIAYTEDKHAVDRKVAKEAVDDMGGAYLVGERVVDRKRENLIAFLPLVIAILFMGALMIMYWEDIIALFRV
ncbi:MAG: AAA family ATPase [Deltaproteobacteria bacterium]|nr:AAA family ATPase [Deltaproteobacteria bacterium]MBN2844996.1 AAA family ATPase [Deltaproteobacteria bacterium]